MESSYGPNSTDEPSLLYKLQRKIKVFNTNNTLPNRGYNLVTCSSKYGLVFVGTPDGILTVYYLKDIVDKDCEPQHITINLKERPTHIAVSCDQELLAVTGGQLLSIYKVSNFQNPNPQTIDIRLDKTSSFVSGLQWNPILPDNLAMVFFDGSLLVANISASPQVKLVQSKARCLCWSPKGKQLVTGNSDGTLTQYKPDLTPAKNIPSPNLFEGAAIEALAVYWISTFMFAVVYRNAIDNSRPVVTVVTTPKGNPPHCLNYEDICFSMGANRPWYYYLQAIPQWYIIMASSSNSMEIGTLGSKKDGETWTQWCQNDEARPELPLTDKKIENFPIGIWIDTCAIHQLPWGENTCLPPMPLLHVLSNNGVLTTFNVINLNKDAPQIYVPLQQLTLPAAAMTSGIPGEAPDVAQPVQVPTPVQAPTPAQVPTPIQVPTPVQAKPMVQSTPQPQSAAPPPQYSASVINIPKPPSYTQSQINQGYAPVPLQEQKQAAEIKPTPPQSKVTAAPTVQASQPVAPKAQTPQQALENAALKAEQERLSEMKANQELKDMLVKEVNDFQKELYKFMVKTRETQAKLQRDINSIESTFNSCSIDSDQLKKECCLEDLRGTIVQLKLELVRACAVVAEARTHAEAKDLNQWTQADPLTIKRVASVKKLAYYVQNQLEQAQKALDYKWSEALARDPYFNKPGQRMIRPILDDVYQPLVKQQEILSRQQAVLRTLRNTLKDCDVTPMFKSTSLLRNTPFRNKDPLSKLTKNILNMSIEPEKTKEPLLSSQKLDALRDMLSNHKTVKIKPVNVEMRQHLATMKLNYEKSLKEKAQAAAIKSPPDVKPQVNFVAAPTALPPYIEAKIKPKQEPPSPFNVPTLNPFAGMKTATPGLTNVARTLFTDEPKSELPKPFQMPQPTQPKPSAFVSQYAPITPVPQSPASPVNTRSVLKDLLQNKQANIEVNAIESKSDSNTFMGQKICSPSSFAFSAPTVSSSAISATRTTAFAAKPTSGTNNIFSKLQPQSFVPESKPTLVPESKPTVIQESKPSFVQESKPQAFEPKPQVFAQVSKPPASVQEPKPQIPVATNSKSSEKGEAEATESTTFTLKLKTDKPITNLFGTKTSTPTSVFNVPDVLKTTQEVAKPDSKTLPKPVEKENLPEKAESKVIQKSVIEKKEEAKTLTVQTNKTSMLGPPQSVNSSSSSSPSSTESTPTEAKSEPKIETEGIEKSVSSVSSSASSIFAAGNASVPTVSKPQPLTITSKPDVATSKSEPVVPASTAVENTTSPSTFSLKTSPSAASVFGAAVAAQSKNTSQASSIFASAAATSPSSTPASIFGSSSQGSIFGSSQTSVFTPPSLPVNTQVPDSATQESASSGLPAVTTQSGSIFGSSVFASTTTTSSTASVFGSSSTSVFASATTKASILDATTTAPSAFSSTATTTPASIFSPESTTSTPSAFTAAVTQASAFGASATTTQSSVFGTSGGTVFASAKTNTNQTSVFGGQPALTQSTPLFGTATSTTQSSVFGTPTATTQTSVFGTPTATTQTSVFGTPTATTQASVFGTQTATTQASVFGTQTATTQASVFGTQTATTQASVFGSPPATTQASVFGSPPATTARSVFGTPTATTQTSVFGTPTATTQASIFGTPTATTQSSVFGSAPTQTSVFGTSDAAAAQSGSLFGGAETNLFAAASISTTSAPSQTSTGSSFGVSSSGSVFGSGNNTNVFGGKSAFGQPNPTAASIFGGGGATSFGQKPAGNFWSFGSGNTEGGFGSPSGGFGQQATTQASSIFGGTTGGSFSTPSPAGQAFGSPQPGVFSTPQQQTGTASAFGGSAFGSNQSVFGSSASFGSPSGGFGSSFGGGFNKSPSSGFGAPAAFGGGATFGGGAAFGSTSPGKVFGGAAPAPAFSPTQSNATFESLATQNTLTFGNLAQQSGQPQQQAPSFNTSPSFTGWRG